VAYRIRYFASLLGMFAFALAIMLLFAGVK